MARYFARFRGESVFARAAAGRAAAEDRGPSVPGSLSASLASFPTGQHAPQDVISLNEVMAEGSAYMEQNNRRQHVRADHAIMNRIE
jgi:hypothetical protein